MFFIINPASARGRTLRVWKRVREELQNRHIEFTEHITRYAGEATAITRSALIAGNNFIVSVGGDGTLNEIINGYFDEKGHAIDQSASIGLIPSGTGSDFCRNIGLKPKLNIDNLLCNNPRQLIDVARVELTGHNGERISRYLLSSSSFGLGGEVAARVNSWRYKLPRIIGGQIRYIASVIFALRKYCPVPVTIRIDQGEAININSQLLVVANGRYAGGGMLLAPPAKLDDGLLDLIITNDLSRLDILKQLPRIRQGKLLLHPKIKHAQAKTVEISSDVPLAIEIDGEFAGYTPARLMVIPSVLRFIIC